MRENCYEVHLEIRISMLYTTGWAQSGPASRVYEPLANGFWLALLESQTAQTMRGVRCDRESVPRSGRAVTHRKIVH